MKKAIIPAALLGGAIGVGVVLYGARAGWFSSPEPGPGGGVEVDPASSNKKDREPRYEDPKTIVTTEGAIRLESLKKAKASELSEALRQWSEQKGIERRISWQAVVKGCEAGQGRETRVRACRLAAALATGKPKGAPQPPPADPGSVKPLLGCLGTEDAELAGAAATALGSIHLHNPALKLDEAARPRIREMIASDDSQLALAGARAAVFFQDIDSASAIVAAWEKRPKDKAFSSVCYSELRILLELHLKAKLKKPGSRPTPKEMAAARQQSRELASKFGTDIAEWKTYWAEARSQVKAP